MSVESLMTQTVTVGRPTGESQSASGEVTTTYEWVETQMYIEPLASEEVEADRNTPIGNWRGFGRADFDFESVDKVVWDTHTFQVIGPPQPEPNARLGTISHVQLNLREIDTPTPEDATAHPAAVAGEGGT